MSIRQSLVATMLGATALFSSFAVQAKDNEISKEQAYEMCGMTSFIAHEAFKEHQAKKAQKVAQKNLEKRFIDAKDGKEVKEFFTGLIEMAVKDAYKLPVPKTAQEKEQALKEYALGVFTGCVEEFGYKLEDFQDK